MPSYNDLANLRTPGLAEVLAAVRERRRRAEAQESQQPTGDQRGRLAQLLADDPMQQALPGVIGDLVQSDQPQRPDLEVAPMQVGGNDLTVDPVQVQAGNDMTVGPLAVDAGAGGQEPLQQRKMPPSMVVQLLRDGRIDRQTAQALLARA